MKELELVISGLRVDMPHKVIDNRIVDVLEALGKRISKLEGGIVASADALADLEYRHMKRIEAVEAQSIPFDGWFENLHKRVNGLESARTDLARQVSDIECRQDIVECGHGKPTTPLSCCEGCANKECGIRGRYGGDRRPCCYQLQFGLHFCCVGCINWPCPECQVHESIDEFRRRVAEMKCYSGKHTCGDCRKPFRKEHYNLACWCRDGWHSAMKPPDWVRREEPACPNFEAIK